MVPSVADFPHWFLVGVASSLGFVFGSFLNVVIHRLPRGESVSFPGSRCPACQAPIRPWDNIPVLSWIVLRGRARCCKAPISPRYPLVELIGGLLGWAILDLLILAEPTTLGLSLVRFALYLALSLGLVAAAFIDLEYLYLPDRITVGGAMLGLASAPLRPEVWLVAHAPWGAWADDFGPLSSWWDAGFGAITGFLLIWLPFDVLYRVVRGRTGMALGDAKLTMLAGAWFGWPGALFALMAGALQGTVVTLLVWVAQGRTLPEPEAVRRERLELEQAISAAEGREREELERLRDRDPIHEDLGDGFLASRLAFGPFLVLGILEHLFLGEALMGPYVAALQMLFEG